MGMSIKDSIHVDAGRLRADRREALLKWVRTHGVNPEDVRAEFLITQGEREWELHLSRFVRNEHGDLILDPAIDNVVLEPLVIGIGPERSWPDLTGGIVQ